MHHPDTSLARTVAANPLSYCHTPTLFQIAWNALLIERNRQLRTEHIGPARHLIEPTGTCSLSARIQARATELGRTGPVALICPGARS
ncbi:hypothetical protein GI582_18010 [Sulfitobacter sp. BDSS02]|nr:hypothetical protein [Sulfitobacter sp. BDSS02]MBR9850922.1 hypothetical protein [Paracoccaceae bacterium]